MLGFQIAHQLHHRERVRLGWGQGLRLAIDGCVLREVPHGGRLVADGQQVLTLILRKFVQGQQLAESDNRIQRPDCIAMCSLEDSVPHGDRPPECAVTLGLDGQSGGGDGEAHQSRGGRQNQHGCAPIAVGVTFCVEGSTMRVVEKGATGGRWACEGGMGLGEVATTENRVVAYQLAVASLPRRRGWLTALGARNDGVSPAGVFAVLDSIRMTYQARVGDLCDGEPSDASGLAIDEFDAHLNATRSCCLVALQVAIDSLPNGTMWERALSLREDGTDPATVIATWAEMRMELHGCIGSLQDEGRSAGVEIVNRHVRSEVTR